MSTTQQNFILSLRPIASLEKPSEIIRQFTPNWFAATMGTGILAIALAQFPAIPALFLLGQGLWLFNLVLFTLFALIYGARWVMHFDGARRVFDHSSMSMFLGCIPMGLATIVNGFIIFGIPLFGETAVSIAQTLWWVDAVIAVVCGIGVPFLMFTRHDHAIDQMTAIWLLPVVACEVTAASGGLMLPHLTDSATQLTILFASYALWACSVPMAMSIIVILVLRMAVHKLPPASMAASSWLALGPIGTGALAMLLFAQNGPAVLVANGLGIYADAMGGASLLVGILLWGYGFWWLAMAGLITARYFRNPVPFNLGWWAYVFPLGVYAVTTMRLAGMFPIGLLSLFGAALAAAVAAVFIIVATRTIAGAWRGDLFNAPCLATD
jgi:C4-dicarboxylate transporter/malic acid transport protein